MQGGPRTFSQSSTSSDLLDRRRSPGAYGTVTFCGRPFQSIRLSSRRRMARGHGLVRFRSPLLTESRLISFPPGTEMFQFPGFAPDGLCIQPPVTPAGCPVASGCPIRRSPDQRVIGHSPELIAAFNVLHRLCTPRHPPCTLSSLTTFMNSCAQTTPVFGQITLRRPAHARRRGLTHPTVLIPTHPPMNLSKIKAVSHHLSAFSRHPLSQALKHPQMPGGLRPHLPPLEPTGLEPATSALQTRRSPS